MYRILVFIFLDIQRFLYLVGILINETYIRVRSNINKINGASSKK